MTAGVGQSYVNPPRKVPVDNLENFNDRPEDEELEVCGQAKMDTLECQNIVNITT